MEEGISPEALLNSLRAKDEALGLIPNKDKGVEDEVNNFEYQEEDEFEEVKESENSTKREKTFLETTETEQEVIAKYLAKQAEKDKESSWAQKSIKDQLGYVLVPNKLLPTNGKFYPKGAKVLIRSLKTNEIKHWSTLNDQDLVEVDNYLNFILTSACRLEVNGKNIGANDICVPDKMALILKIKELTFIEGNKINLPFVCKKCSHQEEVELNSLILTYNEESETLAKYYDEEKRCYIVKTKSHGDLVLHCPRIGVYLKTLQKMRASEQAENTYERSFFICLPFMTTQDKKVTDEKEFQKLYKEFSIWSAGKFSIYYNLMDQFKLGIDDKIEINCRNCGAEVTSNFNFPNGIKSIFIVSDLDSELV